MCRKLNVLVAFANPEESARLKLGAEHDVIKEAIGRSRCRDGIRVTAIQAMTVDRLRREMLDGRFHMVHLGGHGTRQGQAVAETPSGGAYPIPADALAELFGAHAPPLECVVLNECFSAAEAALIGARVPVVIGMPNAIADCDGLKFAEGFFEAIGAGRDPDQAFDEGLRAVRLVFPDTNFQPIKLTRPDDAAIEVIIRTRAGDHPVRVRPQMQVRDLLDQAKCVAQVKDAAAAGPHSRIPVKWTLVDLKAEDFYEMFPNDEKAKLLIAVQSATGPFVSARGSDRLQELGVRPSTVFHLYPAPDPTQPIEPEKFDKF